MKIKEAAKLLGVSPQFLRLALQQNKYYFGEAVQCEKQYAYHINEKALYKYLEGDMPPVTLTPTYINQDKMNINL